MNEERRRKISETMKGRTLSEEHKANISKGKKGCTISDKTVAARVKAYWATLY